MNADEERRYLEGLRARLVPASRRRAAPSGGDETAADESEGSYLSVEIGRERMLVPIRMVEEVILPPEPTHVPRASACVLGTFMHRGLLVPLIDAAALLGIPEATDDAKRRVVVLGEGEELMALALAAVHGIFDVPEERWEPLPAPHRFVSRATRIDQELAGLLDVGALFSLPPAELAEAERPA